MLEIKNLEVKVEGKKILKGVNLQLRQGEIGLLMGPNGSGKSSLAYTLMGHPDYKISGGRIELDGKNIAGDGPDIRAEKGIFLAFQYPVGISGISTQSFLRQAYEAVHCRRCKSGTDMDHCARMTVSDFRNKLLDTARTLKIKPELLKRPINEGFSGGEKKRVEILQMAILKPYYAVLDETDSGLDIDGLRVVAEGINRVRRENKKLSLLVITHYERILRFIKPQFVSVMADGRIVKSGGESLARKIEKNGYKEYA
jgi:Fe-S cluster assembly ATP-binding protein